jgi:hypothetical protein
LKATDFVSSEAEFVTLWKRTGTRRARMGSARIARIVGLSERFSANMRRELEN